MEKTPKYVKNICKHLTNDAKKKILIRWKRELCHQKKIRYMKSKDLTKNTTLKCLAEILEAEKHLQYSRRLENLKNLFKSKKLYKATSSNRIEEQLKIIKKSYGEFKQYQMAKI